ncbi:MAG: DUF4922 domain-containing protein [Prevotella sp.]
MRQKIDCFLTCDNPDNLNDEIAKLRNSRTIQNIFILTADADYETGNEPEGCGMIEVDRPTSSATIRKIAAAATAEYILLLTKSTRLSIGQTALERLLRVASDSNAAMVYSDHYSLEEGQLKQHPAIDYQKGSVRDDFDFGSLLLIKTPLLHDYARQTEDETLLFGALYDMRLFLSRQGEIFHINEYLYTEEETDLRTSGAKQFDYVNPANRKVQIEMEQCVTRHLEAIGALIDTSRYKTPDFNEQDFDVEATVVIPVKNREKTIRDAVESALRQKTNFKFNVIVVDNHSTDRTGEIIEQLRVHSPLSTPDSELIHIIPERFDLGIGGCWNIAICDSRCGRFAVQLDSDDLYSGTDTLQRIVDAFKEQKAAMIIGSYRMCDFDLNTLPPGLIDHHEWTEENGPNNALRINGLGAPRAFFTPLLRQIQFPNTSYGEDYALGLIFSRHYRIGRIYDELYLCRRWGGNSDAALSVEKVNANNLYKDRLRTLEISARQQQLSGKEDIMADSTLLRFFNRQIETWDDARKRYIELQNVKSRELQYEDSELILQFNPARITSTGAKIDKQSIAKRACFLCEANRPTEQIKKDIDERFELLVNPYPILPTHFTIPSKRHEPQKIKGNFDEMMRILSEYPDQMVFYNGPKCGASAPDHAHFQAGTKGMLPLQRSWQRLSRNLKPLLTVNDNEGIWQISDYICFALLLRSHDTKTTAILFERLYNVMPQNPEETEPMMNIIAWRQGDDFITVVIPRSKHRPDCYYADGTDQCLVSPGALDMSGLIITPREEDFRKLTAERAVAIIREVALNEEDAKSIRERLKSQSLTAHHKKTYDAEPEVTVGILSAQKITFDLNAPYTAKGESIEGLQMVEFSEGGILWRGNQYRELTFTPQSDDASFSLHEVTIGIDFHWQRKQTQTFNGTLLLVVEADKITAINRLPVEQYLSSVISSEMRSTSSAELLKAHSVISRSWLLAQMEKRQHLKEGQNNFFSFIKKEDEIIRWYDREDHTIFDVCADDHCQRYQGITTERKAEVMNAVRATRGQVLVEKDEICDARFSKCCGGVTEEFQNCWENIPKPYLIAVRDGNGIIPDLTDENQAKQWIMTSPPSFCNTNDQRVLAEVLNDYDQETPDFYRWHVEYSQEELTALINEKTKDDFGKIVDLIPQQRGKSGRICRLKIIGTKKTLTIGKELEIRRTLSQTHLYSSAFVVEREEIDNDGIPQRFILTGAGWGHGVGMCQIGAAMMSNEDYNYDDILLHYYRGAEIKKLYE